MEKEHFGLNKLSYSATPGKCCVYLRTGHNTFLLLPSPLNVEAWWGLRDNGGVDGRGTALQAGRPRFWFPMASLEFFIDITLSAAL